MNHESLKQTPLTLEQQRAQNTWECASGKDKDYINVAKSLPALIMNSGLLQTLAFCQEKGKHHEKVAKDLRCWLAKRIGIQSDPGFERFSEILMRAHSPEFQAVTIEAFAWLRWLRQMAPARNADQQGS